MSATALTPAPSRHGVTPAMAARGLRSAADLAANKPCGTRVRYYAGCRCRACKAANSSYERERQAARARGEGNGLVCAAAARAHLAWLSTQGVGRRQAADAAKVAASTVFKVIDGERLKIRAQSARRILAVTPAAAADGALIDGGPTWVLLDELIADNYSRARLATEIAGRPLVALQIARDKVTVRTAEIIRRAYDRLRLADAAASKQAFAQLSALRDEHYRMDWIQREIDAMAAAKGWPSVAIGLPTKRGRWPAPDRLTARAVALIEALYARVFGEGEA